MYREKGCTRRSIQYYVDGRRVRESTQYKKKRDAVTWLTAQINKVNEGKTPERLHERHPVTVRDLYCKLETDVELKRPWGLADCRQRWRHLEPILGSLPAAKLTSDQVTEYCRGRKAEGAANATINRELALLRRMYTLASHATPPRVLRVPYIEMLPENNVRKGFVEDDAFSRLVAETKEPWMRTFLELDYTYGFRRSELLALKVRQNQLRAANDSAGRRDYQE